MHSCRGSAGHRVPALANDFVGPSINFFYMYLRMEGASLFSSGLYYGNNSAPRRPPYSEKERQYYLLRYLKSEMCHKFIGVRNDIEHNKSMILLICINYLKLFFREGSKCRTARHLYRKRTTTRIAKNRCRRKENKFINTYQENRKVSKGAGKLIRNPCPS